MSRSNPRSFFGTPVVLISTLNEDGSANLAPMSSAWWLGWRCMLGLQTASKTPQKMIRTGQCVLNLVSPVQADAVNRLARLTGTEMTPELKQRLSARRAHIAGRPAPLAAAIPERHHPRYPCGRAANRLPALQALQAQRPGCRGGERRARHQGVLAHRGQRNASVAAGCLQPSSESRSLRSRKPSIAAELVRLVKCVGAPDLLTSQD